MLRDADTLACQERDAVKRIAEKASFASTLREGRRCLVPVNGYFEFTGEKGSKQPWYFRPKREGDFMAFPSLWERWLGPKGGPPAPASLLTYTIATTTPNAVGAPIMTACRHC